MTRLRRDRWLIEIIDVDDALISKRVYKEVCPHQQAVEMSKRGRGSHFAPDILDAFVEMSAESHQIALEEDDHEAVAESS